MRQISFIHCSAVYFTFSRSFCRLTQALTLPSVLSAIIDELISFSAFLSLLF